MRQGTYSKYMGYIGFELFIGGNFGELREVEEIITQAIGSIIFIYGDQMMFKNFLRIHGSRLKKKQKAI